MHLPRFNLLRPRSFTEALEFLERHGADAQIVAGGTDILPRLKYGLLSPEFVISLKRLHADSPVLTSEGNLRLGSLMTLADVGSSQIIRQNAPLLAEAAEAVGSKQVRHMGTLGGNICLENRCLYYNQGHEFQFIEPCFKRKGDSCYLFPKGKKCWAVFMGDTAPALISLGAELEIASHEKMTLETVEGFYTGDPVRPNALSRYEMIRDILIPMPVGLRGSAFVKLSPRGGLDFATLSIAVVLDMADDGVTCLTARITLGAVSPRPSRVPKAEEALAEQRLSSELFRSVSEIVQNEVNPVTHHGFSRAYLKKCLQSQTFDALTLAASRVEKRGT